MRNTHNFLARQLAKRIAGEMAQEAVRIKERHDVKQFSIEQFLKARKQTTKEALRQSDGKEQK